MDEQSDRELLEALGVAAETKKVAARTPREERIIAGFEDILKFVDEHGRPPQHGEERDIFERLYAIRLDRLREQADCRTLLAEFDRYDILEPAVPDHGSFTEDADDNALLAELGVEKVEALDITNLTHVKSREEVRAAEEIANRTVCEDFDRFKPILERVKKDLEAGVRQTRRFQTMAEIKQGEFFIVGGQIAYVAEVGEEFVTEYDRRDSRLRVIYDNGTESDVLLRSLQRALHRDEAGRRITDPSAGPLFGGDAADDDLESGTIYVLRSKSQHPEIAPHRELIHKIGVTGGKVETRIANAALDATYLLADVEIVATYKLFNINKTRLENVLHRVFSAARLDLTIEDRFGHPVRPREWFLVPLSVIDEVVDKIRDGSITEFEYEPELAGLRKTAN
ncbi:MAG: GIY-YIG nuclease family protein [Mesorhizobium sp.]|uniref:GIY-YIG nuclease family protein n=1 Tax=Mesorhizobium sp. TaxID=1871066 RepID=UPI000FE4D77F|nr:GIY-YIG nuclease family protein [Mesorhizobium sp.]RWA75345.1 MAG: GIY-YIG nuclease family protein [Mesorhizobium sp.]